MQAGDFPSLSKRPYEDGAAIGSPAPVAPATAANLPAPLQAEVSRALAKSGDAHEKFLSNLPGVKNRVNAAGRSSISSESWVVAQMDLSALELIRSPSVNALADIDTLYLERLTAEYEGEQPGGAQIIAKHRKQIQDQVKAQQDEIDSMKARLR